MPEKKEAVFSKSIKTKSKTYFIDVKEASNGNKYLTICESRRVEGKYENSRILIFKDDIAEIFQALREASQVIKGE